MLAPPKILIILKEINHSGCLNFHISGNIAKMTKRIVPECLNVLSQTLRK